MDVRGEQCWKLLGASSVIRSPLNHVTSRDLLTLARAVQRSNVETMQASAKEVEFLDGSSPPTKVQKLNEGSPSPQISPSEKEKKNDSVSKQIW